MASPRTNTSSESTSKVPPIIIPLCKISGIVRVTLLAIALGKGTKARVIFIKPPSTMWKSRALKSLEERIKTFAADEVKFDKITVHHIPGNSDEEAQVASLERIARANDFSTVLIPVEREVLMQEGPERKGIEWTKDLPNKRIILVHGSEKPVDMPLKRPIRVLIPIMHELHKGPFEFAWALNTNPIIPDVEVIAARVLELPADSSQYSIYSQDSQSIGDEHLAFIKTNLSRDIQRIVHPLLLPVQHPGSEIVDFSKAREVDLIIMEGYWNSKGTGLLTQIEKDIVAKAGCTVVVIIDPQREMKSKVDGPKKNKQ